jgi:hypothetical protein
MICGPSKPSKLSGHNGTGGGCDTVHEGRTQKMTLTSIEQLDWELSLLPAKSAS